MHNTTVNTRLRNASLLGLLLTATYATLNTTREILHGNPQIATIAGWTPIITLLLTLTPLQAGSNNGKSDSITLGVMLFIAYLVASQYASLRTGGLGLTGKTMDPVGFTLNTASRLAEGLGIALILAQVGSRLNTTVGSALAGLVLVPLLLIPLDLIAAAPIQHLAVSWAPSAVALVVAGLLASLYGSKAAAGFLVPYWVAIGVSPVLAGTTPLSRIIGALSGLAIATGLIVVYEKSRGRRGNPGRLEMGRSSRGRARVLVSKTLYALTIVLLVLSVTGYVIGLRGVVVTSGSMRPTINPGDIAVVLTSNYNVENGSIVLYRHENGLIIHRAVSIGPANIITRGDANPGPDPWRVNRTDIVGVYVFRIPLVGKPFLWLTSASRPSS